MQYQFLEKCNFRTFYHVLHKSLAPLNSSAKNREVTEVMTVVRGFHFYDSMLDIFPSPVMQGCNIL